MIMAMLPIFMIGMVVGIALSYAFYKYKEDTPSNAKIEWQEREIEQLERDNDMLMNLNEKLYNKINDLKQELNK